MHEYHRIGTVLQETFEGENFLNHGLVGREHFAEKTFPECKLIA